MGPALAIEKFQVDEEGLAAAAQAYREALLHTVEKERLLPFDAASDPNRLAGQRRHEHLWLETSRGDLGGLRNLGRQEPLFDQKHIGVEAGALVSSPNLADHPVDANHLSSREVAFQRDDIVELKKAIGLDPYPELERGGVLGPDDPADGLFYFAHFH